jgi:hypothetical protein
MPRCRHLTRRGGCLHLHLVAKNTNLMKGEHSCSSPILVTLAFYLLQHFKTRREGVQCCGASHSAQRSDA